MITPKIGDVLVAKPDTTNDMTNSTGVVEEIQFPTTLVKLRVTKSGDGGCYDVGSLTSYADWYSYMDISRNKKEIKKKGYKL